MSLPVASQSDLVYESVYNEMQLASNTMVGFVSVIVTGLRFKKEVVYIASMLATYQLNITIDI